jgi:hypothetical protein
VALAATSELGGNVKCRPLDHPHRSPPSPTPSFSWRLFPEKHLQRGTGKPPPFSRRPPLPLDPEGSRGLREAPPRVRPGAHAREGERTRSSRHREEQGKGRSSARPAPLPSSSPSLEESAPAVEPRLRPRRKQGRTSPADAPTRAGEHESAAARAGEQGSAASAAVRLGTSPAPLWEGSSSVSSPTAPGSSIRRLGATARRPPLRRKRGRGGRSRAGELDRAPRSGELDRVPRSGVDPAPAPPEGEEGRRPRRLEPPRAVHAAPRSRRASSCLWKMAITGGGC